MRFENNNKKPNPYVYQSQPTYTAKKSKPMKRKNNKSMKRFLVLCLSLVVLFAAAWVLVGVIQNTAVTVPSVPNVPNTPASTPPSVTPPTSTPVIPPNASAGNNSSWNFLGTVVPLAQQGIPVTPDKRIYALPENGRINSEYFNTAVFVGDSLTQGLHIYGGLDNAKFCDYKGVSPKQIYDGSLQQPLRGEKEVPLDAIVAAQPDNVYVLLGTNAMVGMSNEALLAYYGEMLAALRERLPEAVCIYVQSITPVVQGVDNRFHMEDFVALNNALAELAFENGMYFLDLHEALAGDDGWLRADYGAADGYHLQPAGYDAWVEYLATHTAYNPRHAHLYEENPAPFQQLPPVA